MDCQDFFENAWTAGGVICLTVGDSACEYHSVPQLKNCRETDLDAGRVDRETPPARVRNNICVRPPAVHLKQCI